MLHNHSFAEAETEDRFAGASAQQSALARPDAGLVETGWRWDAVRMPAYLGDRVLAGLGARSGAVIRDPYAHALYWLVAPDTARAWAPPAPVPFVRVLGRGSSVYVPEQGCTRSPGPHWAVPADGRRVRTDAGLLRDALSTHIAADLISSRTYWPLAPWGAEAQAAVAVLRETLPGLLTRLDQLLPRVPAAHHQPLRRARLHLSATRRLLDSGDGQDPAELAMLLAHRLQDLHSSLKVLGAVAEPLRCGLCGQAGDETAMDAVPGAVVSSGAAPECYRCRNQSACRARQHRTGARSPAWSSSPSVSGPLSDLVPEVSRAC